MDIDIACSNPAIATPIPPTSPLFPAYMFEQLENLKTRVSLLEARQVQVQTLDQRFTAYTPSSSALSSSSPASAFPSRAPTSGLNIELPLVMKKTLGSDYRKLSALTPSKLKCSLPVRLFVVERGEVRAYQSGGHSGEVFSLTLADSEGTAVRASFWATNAARYHSDLEPNHVFDITGYMVKAVSKYGEKYNPKIELSFNDSTGYVEAV